MSRACVNKKQGLNPRRRTIVEQAFLTLDKNGAGTLNPQEVLEAYDAERIPIVWHGDSCQGRAFDQFKLKLAEFINKCTGSITFSDFCGFYQQVSEEINQSQIYDKDAFFEKVVSHVWNLDQNSRSKLQPTGLVVSTVDLPEDGMSKAKNMDLIFLESGNDGKEGAKSEDSIILGFPSVVRTIFSRSQLPEVLQGYFALYGELERVPHRYLPCGKSAKHCPFYDFVWPTETGEWTGLKGVISSSVERSQLPDELRALVKTQQESKNLCVSYINTTEQMENPCYRTSNSLYGRGAQEVTLGVHELKTKTYNGEAAGIQFYGRSGKFTDKMPPPVPPTGLNCGVIRRPLGQDYLY